jgi:hypothetical protein
VKVLFLDEFGANNMTTIYGCYFTASDYTEWFPTRMAARLHGSASGDDYIIRESVGHPEDL